MRAPLAEVVLRLIPLVVIGLSAGVVIGAEWPAVDRLPEQPGLPDPLTLFDGRKVTSKEEWVSLRRPELKSLFAYYMYGAMPAPPASVTATLDREERRYFDGKATLKELTITFGPAGTPPIHLLLVVPNERKGPAPVFLGPNFLGNHTALKDPRIALPTVWVPNTKDHKASDVERGSQTDVWNIEEVIGRGYALATFYCGDVAPDHPGLADGVFPHYRKPGESEPGPHDWGAVAAWAWGISRALDYLITDADIDKSRVAAVGHSRLGKATIVAGAYDERISLVIPHQAGCGGTAPNRIKVTTPLKHETVKRINESFPHWFDQTFKLFNEQTDRLPFDQNCLIALIAPRPVLLTNAEDDQWANPSGQFRMLQAAEPVYRLVGAGGLDTAAMPESGRLVASNLGYFIRPGKHSMGKEDWKIFLEYADLHFGKAGAK